MFWFTSRIQKQRVIPVFRGGTRTCSGAGARPRKDRNDVGLGLFVIKDDDVFLLRRRRHFFRAKFRMKRSSLSARRRYKKQEVLHVVHALACSSRHLRVPHAKA